MDILKFPLARNTNALFSFVLQIQEKIEVARDVDNVNEEYQPSSDRPHKQIRLRYLGERVQTRLVQNQAGTVNSRFTFWKIIKFGVNLVRPKVSIDFGPIS